MVASLIGWKVVDSTSASITSVSVDPSTPTGGSAIATGDLCVLLCVGGVTAAGDWAASGFTSMHLLTQGTRRYGALRRVRQSGDSSYTATCPTTNGAQVVLVWFRDFDATLTGLVVGSEYHRTASGSTTAAPSVTSTVNDSLIACFGLEASTTSESDVTSISQGSKAFFAPQTSTPQIHTTVVSSFTKTTAGASGTTTITYPNAAANGFGFQLAIPPAAASNVDPVAEFSSVRTGLTVQFTDASTDADGTITGWAWDFDDTGTSTSQNPSHTFAAGAAYDVQLTVTDDDSATDAVTHTVTIPASAETAGGHVLYDAFARYSDGLTPAARTALTGQTWDVYSPPDAITGGLWDSTDDSAAYLHTDGTAEVVYLKARFLWDTVGGTRTANTGTVAIGVTNDIANLAARKFRAHLVMTPAAVQMSVQTTAGGSLSSVGSQSVTTTKDAYHTLELTLTGTGTATVYVDGSQVAQWTDSRMAEDSAQHQVFFEPYYNNDASAVRARFAEVWADWGVVRTGDGALTLAGSASGTASGGTATRTATGTLTAAGSAAAVEVEQATATGTLTLSGSAAAIEAELAGATGSLTLTGTATGAASGGTATRTATGTLTAAGDATADIAGGSTTRTATGTLAVAGTAAGTADGGTQTRTASGTLTVTGAATGTAGGGSPERTAAGTVTASGTATAAVVAIANALGALSLAAIAAHLLATTATGSLALAGNGHTGISDWNPSPSRTHRIPAANRSYTIPAGDRTFRIRRITDA